MDEPEMTPRVLVADDHDGMRKAITFLITPVCEVVGYVVNGADLLEKTTRLRPDVVVLDLNMPGINGIEGCRQIKETIPQIKVIMISAADDDAIVRTAVQARASGYVSKMRAGDDLLPAIQSALADETRSRRSVA
jgi:DNA-binding NarL/FixJ family response regulator